MQGGPCARLTVRASGSDHRCGIRPREGERSLKKWEVGVRGSAGLAQGQLGRTLTQAPAQA